jgi:phage-related protein
MFWQYITQFWEQIHDVIVGGITYTAEYFTTLANAIAGAIGGFFDAIFHNISDLFCFLSWFFANIKQIFIFLLSPISYIFTLLKYFFASLNAPTPTPTFVYAFDNEVLAVFDAIPHFDIFKTVLGAVIIFAGGIAILKLLLHT